MREKKIRAPFLHQILVISFKMHEFSSRILLTHQIILDINFYIEMIYEIVTFSPTVSFKI